MKRWFLLIVALGIGAVLSAAEPCISGLSLGQRPGPYTFVMCTGPNRGQLHCHICENADRPAVIVFARNPSAPLGKLVGRLDKALGEHKDAKLNAWVTFLATDQSAIDAKVIDWGKQHAVSNIPLGVFEDVTGPPSYRLARDADVTIILFVNRKVVANFAWRAGDLNDERIAEVMKSLPLAVGK